MVFVEYPTADPFVYSRENVPLFFIEPTNSERDWFHEKKNSIVREYYKRCRLSSTIIEHTIVSLKSGIMYGELAMLIISDNHLRRL